MYVHLPLNLRPFPLEQLHQNLYGQASGVNILQEIALEILTWSFNWKRLHLYLLFFMSIRKEISFANVVYLWGQSYVGQRKQEYLHFAFSSAFCLELLHSLQQEEESMYYMCKYVCIWYCCYVYLIHVRKNGKLFKMADMQMKCLYRKKTYRKC